MKAFWSRIWAGIAGLTGALASPNQNLPTEDMGLVGSKLSVVQKTSDLFLFFNFAPIGEEKFPDRTVTSFKPTGEAFKALVTLVVTTDDRDTIKKLQLTVVRSFIDDTKKCIYSADLVKSFLASAAATSEDDPVGSLAREINARSMAKSTVTMLTARALPKASGAPSAAYQTYVGNLQPQTLFYKSARLQVLLRNDTQATEPVLNLIVSAKP